MAHPYTYHDVVRNEDQKHLYVLLTIQSLVAASYRCYCDLLL
jgi:hypothetical protein